MAMRTWSEDDWVARRRMASIWSAARDDAGGRVHSGELASRDSDVGFSGLLEEHVARGAASRGSLSSSSRDSVGSLAWSTDDEDCDRELSEREVEARVLVRDLEFPISDDPVAEAQAFVQRLHGLCAVRGDEVADYVTAALFYRAADGYHLEDVQNWMQMVWDGDPDEAVEAAGELMAIIQ